MYSVLRDNITIDEAINNIRDEIEKISKTDIMGRG